jgi:NodT family efflux transporter outer membrane factor (OMF) lipoprotein
MALANNRELRVAIARVAQANAQARIAEAPLYPTLDAYLRRELEAPEQGIGLATSRADWRSLNRFQVGVRANYEVDLWGKNGYAADAALARALASVHERDAVALTLTTDLAASYFEVRSLDIRIAQLRRNLDARRRALVAIETRARGGDANAQEIAQFRNAASTAEAALNGLERRRERAFNRVALLAGLPPTELHIALAGAPLGDVPGIAPGLPSELLCRRPDVRRVEAELAAAQFDVRSVRAALLPAFSLSGDTGLGSRHLAALLNPASLFVIAAASLVQSVLDGGRREAQVELARARHMESLERYGAVLLTAIRETEDALVAVRATAAQHRALVEVRDSEHAALRLSERAFAAGAFDLVAVLESEQRAHAAAEAAEAALYDRLLAAIDLSKALGGGQQQEQNDPCAA